MASQTDKKLFQLTKAIHDRLPPEIRSVIYEHILGQETQGIIALQSRFNPTRWPSKSRDRNRKSECRLLIPGAAYPQVAHEFAAAYFATAQNFAVHGIAQIPSFLQCDFFDLGVCPKDVALSKMTVKFMVGSDDPAHMASSFAPLLSSSQNWSRNFQIDVILTPAMEIELDDENPMEDALQIIMKILKELTPVFKRVEEKGKEGRGAKARLVMSLVMGRGWDVTQKMNDSPDQWREHLRELYEKSINGQDGDS